MYTDGIHDMYQPLLCTPFQPKDDQKKYLNDAKVKVFRRYFCVFEKV